MSLTNQTINHEILSELAESIGPASASRILKIFLDELDTQLEEICFHLDANEIDLIETPAHTMKSTSATFGATDLNAISSQIEQAARNQNHDALVPLVERLKKCVLHTAPLYKMYTE